LPTSKKHDTIQIKLGSTPADAPAEDTTTTSSATDTTEQPMTEPSPARPLTLDELAANRMPVSRTSVATARLSDALSAFVLACGHLADVT
jgi:hypothetical protein